MAKIDQGRLDGVYGMSTYTVEELDEIADEYLRRLDDPMNTDDPKWIKRREKRIRKLARQKEQALEHKLNQRR